MCNIRINELAIDLFEKWYHLIILLYVSKLALLASFNLSAFNSKESLVHTIYNEASKANLDAYKRIIKWQPFFE